MPETQEQLKGQLLAQIQDAMKHQEIVEKFQLNPEELTTKTFEELTKLQSEINDEVALLEERIRTASGKTDGISDLGAEGVDISPRAARKIGGIVTSTMDEISQAGRVISFDKRKDSSSSDINPLDFERRVNKDQFANIVSDIEREGVDGPQQDVNDVLISNESEVTFRSSDINLHTVTGDTERAPSDHPEHRVGGTYLLTRENIIDPTGYNPLTGKHGSKVSGSLLDNTLGLLEAESMTLNALDPRGFIIPGKAVQPKRGKFLVLGMNPYGMGERSFEKHIVTKGFIKREVPYGAGDGTVAVEVVDNNNPIFEVIDITPLTADVTADDKQVIESTRAVLSTLRFKHLDVLDTLLSAATDQTFDKTVQLKYPEFADVNRSTLGYSNLLIGDVDINNYNSVSSINRMFDALQQSEIISVMVRHNLRSDNFYERILAHAGFKGKNEIEDYFGKYGKYNPKTFFGGSISNRQVPTVASVIGNSDSASQTGGMVELMASSRNFKSMLLEIENILDANVLENGVLNNINILRKVYENIIAYQEIGRLNDGETTSANFVSMGQKVNLVLDFDPNDFVRTYLPNEDDAFNSTKNPIPASPVWYAAAGYGNALTTEGGSATQRLDMVYNIVPRWLDVLIEAMQSKRFIAEAFTNPEITANTRYKDNQVQIYFKEKSATAPISMRNDKNNWFDFFFGLAHKHGSSNVQKRVSLSGYARYMEFMNMLEGKEQVTAKVPGMYMTMLDAYNGIIDNPATKWNSSYNAVKNFPTLSPLALELLGKNEDERTFAIIDDLNLDFEGINYQSARVKMPLAIDEYVTEFEGLEFMDSGNGQTHVDLLNTIKSVKEIDLQSNFKIGSTTVGTWLPFSSAGDRTSYPYEFLFGNNKAPILLRKTFSDNDGRLINIPVPAKGSDADLIGYDIHNISNQIKDGTIKQYSNSAQAYVIVRQVKPNSRGKVVKDYVTYSILPIELFMSKGGFNLLTNTLARSIDLQSNTPLAYNHLYTDATLTKSIDSRPLPKENLFTRALHIPSFDGLRYNVIYDALREYEFVEKNVAYIKTPMSGKDVTKFKKSPQDRIQSYGGMLYYPVKNDTEVDANGDEVLTQMPLNAIRAAVFYDRQVGKIIEMIAQPGSAFEWYAKLDDSLKLSNFILSNSLFRGGTNRSHTAAFGVDRHIVRPELDLTMFKAFEATHIRYFDSWRTIPIYQDVGHYSNPGSGVSISIMNSFKDGLHPELGQPDMFKSLSSFTFQRIFSNAAKQLRAPSMYKTLLIDSLIQFTPTVTNEEEE